MIYIHIDVYFYYPIVTGISVADPVRSSWVSDHLNVTNKIDLISFQENKHETQSGLDILRRLVAGCLVLSKSILTFDVALTHN